MKRLNYIPVEDFMKLDKSIQDVFISRWTIEDMDLMTDFYGDIKLACAVLSKEGYTKQPNKFKKNCVITSTTEIYKPVPTESWLRQFIECVINCHIELTTISDGYVLILRNDVIFEEARVLSVHSFDILEVYWQVAVKLATELSNV